MDSSTWADELSALAGFMNNIEARIDVAAASTADAKTGEPRELDAQQREDALAVLASRNSDSAVLFNRARAEAPTASEAKTEVLALMLRAMDDDGRRHFSDQPVDTSGTGLDGPFANEYRAFFSELEASKFDMASTKVQTVWRGRKKRQRLGRWRLNRAKRLRLHFRAWAAASNAGAFFQRVLCKWVFHGWRQTVEDGKRIRNVTWQVFRGRIGRTSLSISAVNLFFADPAIDPPDPLCANALWFGVRRQVLLKLLKAWHDKVKEWQRCRTEAVMTLQRALRLNPEMPKARWAPELKALVFYMWYRSVTYKRCFKAQLRLPTFRDPDLPEWQAWLRSYMRKQLLKQKADKRGLRLFKLNKLRRWRWYTRYMKGLVGRMLFAAQYYQDGLQRKVLRYWLSHTRCRGRLLRRRSKYFDAWKEWAPKKKRLRQLKQLLVMKAAKSCVQQGLRRWTLTLNNTRLVKLFRLRRIIDPDAFFPVMSSMYILSGHLTKYYVLFCFRQWQLLRTRRNAWKAFYYMHQRDSAQHLMSTVFRAWCRCTSKSSGAGSVLGLEPLNAITHAHDLADQVLAGYRPELDLPQEAVRALLPADDETMNSAPPLASKPRIQLTDLELELLAAIESGDAATVERLLENGVRVDFVGYDGNGSTPLHLAAASFAERHLKVVALLLHCGADVSRRDALGRRALDVATNPQVAALISTHSERVASAPTQTELSKCAELMAMQWSEVGGISMWRYVTHGLIEVRSREVEEDISRQLASKSTSQSAPKLNVALARRQCRRLAGVKAAMEEAQCLPEDDDLDSVGDGEKGMVKPIFRGIQRQSSLNGIEDPNDEDEGDLEVLRRRQALRWLSSWSKQQDDTSLHFDAHRLMDMRGEGSTSNRQKLENTAWRALMVCEEKQACDLQLVREQRRKEFERDAYLLKAALRRNVTQDYAALYQTAPPKVPKMRKSPVNSSGSVVDAFDSTPLPLLNVVPDAVSDHLHAYSSSNRRIKINQEVPLICERLRTSILPVEFLRLSAEETTAVAPFWPPASDPFRAHDEDTCGEEGVVVPRQWCNLSRIVSLLRSELNTLQRHRNAASQEMQQQTQQLKVLSECQIALGQADTSTEEGVWSGSEGIREQDAELADSRRRIRGVIVACEREIMKWRKMIARLEGQLDVAYSAQAQRAKMTAAEKVQAAEAEQVSTGKPLPSVSWPDSQLVEYVNFRRAQVDKLLQAISNSEMNANAAKNELVALLSEFEHQRKALRSSNILKLVIMDDLHDTRRAVESEVKATDKRMRKSKARIDTVTADLKQVRLALSALGLAETDDASYDPYASFAESNASLTEHFSEVMSPNDNDGNPHVGEDGTHDPQSGFVLDGAPRSLSEQFGLDLSREPLPPGLSDARASFDGRFVSRGSRTSFDGQFLPLSRASTDRSSQPATSRGTLSTPLTPQELAAEDHSDVKKVDDDSSDAMLETSTPRFRLGSANAVDEGREISETPRFDVDRGSVKSFEQEIVDRYQEALGSLFPDERIKLVDVKKKELEKSSNQEAELLELQKEYGYDGSEEARGEVPQAVLPDTIEPTGALRKDWNRVVMTDSSLPQEEAPLEPAFRRSAVVETPASEMLDLRPASTLPRGTPMHFTMANLGESEQGSVEDEVFYVPEDAIVAPLAEAGDFGSLEPSVADAFGASVSMENDDPPAANDVEALLLEEMSAEEKVERRLNASDSFVGIGQAQDALFEAAEFIPQHIASNDESASGRSTRRGKSRTGARTPSEQPLHENHALEHTVSAAPVSATSRASSSVASHQSTPANSLQQPTIAPATTSRIIASAPAETSRGTTPAISPTRNATHTTTAPSAAPRASAQPPTLSASSALPSPTPPAVVPSSRPAPSVSVASSTADLPAQLGRATTEATEKIPESAASANVMLNVDTSLVMPTDATLFSQGSPGSLASGGSVVSYNSGSLRSLDNSSARSLTIANELEPGITELLIEGHVPWPNPRRIASPPVSAIEADNDGSESDTGFEDSAIEDGEGEFAAAGEIDEFSSGNGNGSLQDTYQQVSASARGNKVADASTNSVPVSSSSASGKVAKGGATPSAPKGKAAKSKKGSKSETKDSVKPERAGPFVAFRLQKWAAELALKKKKKLEKEKREAEREHRRQHGGNSNRSPTRQTSPSSSQILSLEPDSVASQTPGTAPRTSRPKTPPVIGKDSIEIKGVPIESLDTVGTKDANLTWTVESAVGSVVDKSTATVAAVLSGAEKDLPEMTDADFISWMEAFIEAASDETPDEEEMLQQYAVRQAARRAALSAVPRIGLSGLRRGRPHVTQPPSSTPLDVAGVSTFPMANIDLLDSSSPVAPSSDLVGMSPKRPFDESEKYLQIPGHRDTTSRPSVKVAASDRASGGDKSSKVKDLSSGQPGKLEVAGDGLRLPAINQLRAAQMEWSGTMPSLVSAMSTLDKEKVWQTFEQMELSSAAKAAYAELLAVEPAVEANYQEDVALPDAFLTLPPIHSARGETPQTSLMEPDCTDVFPQKEGAEEINTAEPTENTVPAEIEKRSSSEKAPSPLQAAFGDSKTEEASEDDDYSVEIVEEDAEEQIDQTLRAMLSPLDGNFWNDGTARRSKITVQGPPVLEEPFLEAVVEEELFEPLSGLSGAPMSIGGASHANGRRVPADKPPSSLDRAKRVPSTSAQRAPKPHSSSHRAAASASQTASAKALARKEARAAAAAKAAAEAAAAEVTEKLPRLFADLDGSENSRIGSPETPMTPMPLYGGLRQAPDSRRLLVASVPEPTPPAPPDVSYDDTAISALDPLSPLQTPSASVPEDPSLPSRTSLEPVPQDIEEALDEFEKAPPPTKKKQLSSDRSAKPAQAKAPDAKPKRGQSTSTTSTEKADGKAKDKKKGTAKKKKSAATRNGATSLKEEDDDGGSVGDDALTEDDDTVVTVSLDAILTERIPTQPHVTIRGAKKADKIKKKEAVHPWTYLSKSEIKKASKVEKALIKPPYKPLDDDEDDGDDDSMSIAKLDAEYNRRRREATFGSTANIDTDDD